MATPSTTPTSTARMTRNVHRPLRLRRFSCRTALGAAAAGGGSLTAFEKACDEATDAYLAAARRTPFGEETVLCYLAAVENEITAIRIIMTGRQAGLSPEMIRSRLRNAG